jgi:hypothetical protein
MRAEVEFDLQKVRPAESVRCSDNSCDYVSQCDIYRSGIYKQLSVPSLLREVEEWLLARGRPLLNGTAYDHQNQNNSHNRNLEKW